MADKKTKSRIFNILQYEFNTKTGEDLHFNENNILSCVAHKTIKMWAYVRHDKDIVTEEEALKNESLDEGKPKPPHWHIVLKCDNAVEIATIAKWLSIPENFIDMPKGHGAFLDCVQYLTHEAKNQQEKGKHLYSDEEIKASFDFRKTLTERAEKISKYGQDLDPRKQMFHDVLYSGKTIRECIRENDILYMDNVDKIKKYRLEYIQQQTPPTSRINYYIKNTRWYFSTT